MLWQVQRESRKGSRHLLLFFVVIQVIVLVFFLHGIRRLSVGNMGKNLAIRFYNRVLCSYMPGYVHMQKDYAQGAWYEVAACMCPSYAVNEQLLWYENQPEDLIEYENLAAVENEEMSALIKENEQQREVNASKQEETLQEPVGGNEPGEEQSSGDSVVETIESSPVVQTEKKAKVNLRKLQDFDYLLQHFYQVDNTTTIGKKLLDVNELLAYDLTVDEHANGPQILIYHTHSQEGYADSVPGDSSTTVVGVGEKLAELLRKKGFQVLHDSSCYDLPRNRAYSTAAPHIQKILEENPSIEVVIDLHRDGVKESVHLVTEQEGKRMAKIMFFNGLSHTTAMGDLTYLKNPYIKDNLAFSLQAQIAAYEYYPDLTRKIYLKGYRFNMHFCPKTMLVEVGAQNNTLEEAKNAMEPLADILEKILTDTKEE